MSCETCLQRVLATALWLRRARNNPFSNLLVAEEAMTVALKEYDRLVKELQEDIKRDEENKSGRD